MSLFVEITQNSTEKKKKVIQKDPQSKDGQKHIGKFLNDLEYIVKFLNDLEYIVKFLNDI